MNKPSTVILSVAAATLVHLNLVAHPGHNHSHSSTNEPAHSRRHATGEAHDHSQPHAHPHSDTRIPEDLKELWGQINLRTEQLKTALEKTEHEKLHEIDEILTALLRSLPERSPDLAANDRRRVQGQANNLIQILRRIHEQADAENADSARRQWQVFARTLPLLARHFPEEISSHKAEEAPTVPHDHGHSPRHEPQESAGPDHSGNQPHSHE